MRCYDDIRRWNGCGARSIRGGVCTCRQRWMGARDQPGPVSMDVLPCKAPHRAGRRRILHENYSEIGSCFFRMELMMTGARTVYKGTHLRERCTPSLNGAGDKHAGNTESAREKAGRGNLQSTTEQQPFVICGIENGRAMTGQMTGQVRRLAARILL